MLEDVLEEGNLTELSVGINMHPIQLRREISDIEIRHANFIKLETAIKELNELIMDAEMLVESQGWRMNRIESICEAAQDHIGAATKALKYQPKGRRKKIFLCICSSILILILAIVAILFNL